jgi:hypothetical protein
MTTKKHDLDTFAGNHIARVAEKLVALAAEKGRRVTADFNGFDLFAAPGMSVGDVVGAYDEHCRRASEAHEAKRRVHEATPDGQRELAERRRLAAEESRLQHEAVAAVEASGLRARYPWRDGIRELSGFGGGYEAACRTMMYAGLLWLGECPTADARGADKLAFENAILRVEPGCSGAMFGAAASHALFIHEKGYAEWCSQMTEAKAG